MKEIDISKQEANLDTLSDDEKMMLDAMDLNQISRMKFSKQVSTASLGIYACTFLQETYSPKL